MLLSQRKLANRDCRTGGGGRRRTSQVEVSLLHVLTRERGRQYRVRGDVRARLVGEFAASMCQRPPTRHPPPAPRTTTPRPHFHHTGCRISDINDWWRILSPSHAAGCSAANREQRVRDNGVPAHHSLSRTTLSAAAVSRCWRCAFASPIYRHRLN